MSKSCFALCSKKWCSLAYSLYCEYLIDTQTSTQTNTLQVEISSCPVRKRVNAHFPWEPVNTSYHPTLSNLPLKWYQKSLPHKQQQKHQEQQQQQLLHLQPSPLQSFTPEKKESATAHMQQLMREGRSSSDAARAVSVREQKECAWYTCGLTYCKASVVCLGLCMPRL